jgi:cytoskeletal protein CcmA (bactofilin family)
MTGRENAIVLDERRAAWISPSVFMRGKIMASEDLVIDGTFEGTIDVGDHALTIGQSATVTADLLADTITICGTVVGNVTARARLELRATASVEGAVKAPSFAMADGAVLQGTVESGRSTSAHAPRTKNTHDGRAEAV